jgi:hypothetical protein
MLITDREVMQALVTAGALVALADGHLEDVERDELVGFIHRQDFAPTISQRGIAKAFDNRVRELQENYNPNVVIEALRPLAGLFGTSRCCRSENSPQRGESHQPDTADHDEPAGQQVARGAVSG